MQPLCRLHVVAPRPALAAPRRGLHAPCPRPRRLRAAPAPCAAAAATAASKSGTAVPGCVHHVLFDDAGGKVCVTVTKKKDVHEVVLALDGSGGPAPAVRWGTYRTSASKWLVPEGVAPPGSAPSPAGGVVSPTKAAPGGGYELALSLPARLAPVTLGFAVEGAGGARPMPLAVPVGMGVGDPTRLGATLAAPPAGAAPNTQSVNFAVLSRHATVLSLVLVRRAEGGGVGAGTSPDSPAPTNGCLEVALDPGLQRTGDVWHVRVDGLTDLASLAWCWRAYGDTAAPHGARFVDGQVMLDPYAAAVTWLALPNGVNVAPGTGGAATTNPPALAGTLAGLVAPASPPTPRPTRPGLAAEDLVVLEVDAHTFGDGFDLPPDLRGTLAGVAACLDAIAALGVTALALGGPVAPSAPGPVGRSPLSFFAPDPALAAGPDPGAELLALVDAAHGRGIEVLLQVEYCFTGEGDGAGGGGPQTRALSLRGLDAAAYYRPGRGVLNTGTSVVRDLVLASLRHWATRYGVDGFVFVNAEALCQDSDGLVLDAAPLPEALAADAVLRGLKLVASAPEASLLPRGGARGFPHWGVWLEVNWRLAATLRRFLVECRGGVASAVATRVTGSPDLVAAAHDEYPGCLAAGRRPAFGLNRVTPADTPSLAAAAAAGVQLEPNPGVAALQKQALAKTLVLAGLLFQGTPLLAEDAVALVGRRFVGEVLRLRAAHADLLAPRPVAAGGEGDEGVELRWYGAHSACEPDWDEARAAAGEWGANFVAFTASAPGGRAVYVGFNPYPGVVDAVLPPPPPGKAWRRVVDTSLDLPADADSGGTILSAADYGLAARAGLVLVAADPPSLTTPAPTRVARVAVGGAAGSSERGAGQAGGA